MTFAVYCDSHVGWVDIETLDDLAFLNERYGFRKMLIDMNEMTITIIDDEIEKNA